jgi:hypothetical protein
MDDNTSGRLDSVPTQQEQSDPGGNMSDPAGQRAGRDSGNNQAWLDRAIEETGTYTRIHGRMSSTRD